MHVQFDGPKHEKIVSYFFSEQDPNCFSNLGEVDESDQRYRDFYDSLSVIDKIGMPEPE